MAEAMLKWAHMDDSGERERVMADGEDGQRRFELDTRLRNRHHAIEMPGAQILLDQISEGVGRAQLSLAKLQQQRGSWGFGSSNH